MVDHRFFCFLKIRRVYLDQQCYINTIVSNYATYKTQNDVKLHLRAIAYRLKRPMIEDHNVAEEEQQ